ncbi:MAG: hypothetical protein HYT35_00105 [Candidatus Staskawiczbacteria bacterium]|nr:hypothetical protein [Candidatus Staskawiczbacteria bacterium]
MELSNFLANILGFSFIVMSLSLLINQKNIKKLFESVENEVGLFYSGLFHSVVGIAIILGHNLWVSDWRVVITLLGWFALAKGLGQLFFPEMALVIIKKTKNSQWLPYALLAAVVLGCFLIYFGFTA